MREKELKQRLKFLIDAALSGGDLLRRYFGKITVAQASYKKGDPINLVSVADHESQHLIVGKIRKAFPGEAILAEEGDLSRGDMAFKKGPLWVLDPLDGTVNFLHGFPCFAVSFAFCMDGRPLVGAVYAPAQNELFWAQQGSGAYLSAGKAPASGRRLKVTKAARLDNALMVTGFGYDRRERADFYLKYYRSFLRIVHDVRRTGAAAVDLAWLAAGRSDGFWEWSLSPWDVAAGLLLIEEAGGRMTHFDGTQYSIFRSEETLATNGLIHDECLNVVGSVPRG
ncbi:MAG: inositol monophosphatase [Elusimicrobia bacterium]|nr:inositol monophosphatase [Elusimicrobiota bacterium]